MPDSELFSTGTPPSTFGTFRNKNVTFGQKKGRFSRPKTMAIFETFPKEPRKPIREPD